MRSLQAALDHLHNTFHNAIAFADPKAAEAEARAKFEQALVDKVDLLCRRVGAIENALVDAKLPNFTPVRAEEPAALPVPLPKQVTVPFIPTAPLLPPVEPAAPASEPAASAPVASPSEPATEPSPQ